MKKYSQKYLPLIVGAACALGIVMGSFLNFSTPKEELLSANSNKRKLEKLIDYINYDYVDKINTDSIVDITIANILKDLDPHSTYIPKSSVQGAKEELEGDFIGVGIQFFKVQDSIAVIRTIEGGPSEKAGIQAGDRIVYIEENPLYGKDLKTETLREILLKTKDSLVNFKVKRRGESELLDFKIAKNHIPLKSLDASFLLTENLGYVKLNRFSKTTSAEFKKAIEELKKQGGKDIVLDLRNNSGGYLKEAIKIADEFLEEEQLIVFTKNNQGKIKKTYATSDGSLEQAKVYVLIDQNSASASEVVAGALQDNDAATIIGRRSYGKGLVQREMDLGDGSVVRLTVARYYTPTGRSIQKSYKGEGNGAYHHDFLERYQNGELENKDSIHLNDSLKFTTPKGKTVYGGGGIVPDIFVAQDLSYKKESLDYMLKGGMIDRFTFEYLDKNRNYYHNLSQEEFLKKVEVEEEMLEEFADFLAKYNLSFTAKNYENLLKTYLKASMARQLFDNNLYEKILGKEDEVLQKVLKLYAEENSEEQFK